MKFTFYGGINEIGGNKILIEHKGTRILFDFGMSFKTAQTYLSEFLQPRKCNGVGDLIELGLLPDLKGIYRQDYLKHMGKKPEKKAIDAVFISHAHADHAAYIPFIRPDIPVYCTAESKAIFQALEETGAGGFCEYINVCEAFALYKNKSGGLSKVDHRQPEFVCERPINVISNKIKIGSLEIEAVPVDHSLPGACAFIVYSDEGNLVYTGDLRFHGANSEKSRAFVEKAASVKPKWLLCEGTRVPEGRGNTEEDVRRRANSIVSKTKGLVVANFTVRDLDRVNTMYQIAKDNKRSLIIDLKLAYLLKLMQGICECPSLDDSNIKIFLAKKTWGLIDRDDFPENIRAADYETWEREFLSHPNAITASEISKNQDKYMLQCNFFEIKNLIDIKPAKGSSYIWSLCEPFNEEMEIDMKKAENWLKHFGLLPMHHIHASGHMCGAEIEELLDEIKPEIVIPIHTEHADLFESLAPKGVKVELARRKA